jgi:hypothetical protein
MILFKEDQWPKFYLVVTGKLCDYDPNFIIDKYFKGSSD